MVEILRTIHDIMRRNHVIYVVFLHYLVETVSSAGTIFSLGGQESAAPRQDQEGNGEADPAELPQRGPGRALAENGFAAFQA